MNTTIETDPETALAAMPVGELIARCTAAGVRILPARDHRPVEARAAILHRLAWMLRRHGVI